MAFSVLRRKNAGSVRPHWSAQIEDVKNRVLSTVLEILGWDIRIQPFHSYGSTSRVRILAKVLYGRPSSPADLHDRPLHDMRTLAARGWRNFASQVAPHRWVTLEFGEHTERVRSDRAGIIDVMVEVELPPGRHEVRISTHEGNAVTGDVTIVDPHTPRGIVSDIDDTVMVTWLPRPLLAFWNAFVLTQSSRRPVQGMPMLYQQIRRADPSAPFIYLSTGAWNVFPVLRRFLYKNGYPDGPLLLTDWGPTNTGVFRSGMDHKFASLDRLIEMFPRTQWLLIGDDGQHDPQIYGEFSQRNPDHVEAVAIRQLSGGEQLLSHGTTRPLPDGDPGYAPQPRPDEVTTVRAPHGSGLLKALRGAQVLPGGRR